MAPQGGWPPYRKSLEGRRIAARIVFASDPPPGVTLTTVLARAKDWSIVADLSAALFAMRRLLTIADSLQKATGSQSFAIGADRIILTQRASFLIVEPDADTWEFRADGADGARMDIAEIAIAGVSLIAGRAVDAIEASDPQSPVLKELRDATAIRADMTFAGALHEWLDRALAATPQKGFADFDAARAALDELHPPKGSGCRPSRRMLKTFIGDLQLTEFSNPKLGVLEVERGSALRRLIVARRPSQPAAPTTHEDDDAWSSLDFSDSAEPLPAPAASAPPPSARAEEPLEDESAVEFEEYKPGAIPDSFKIPEPEPESEPEESSIFVKPASFEAHEADPEREPESSPLVSPSRLETVAEAEPEATSPFVLPSPFEAPPETSPEPEPEPKGPNSIWGKQSWASSEESQQVDEPAAVIEPAPPPAPPPPPPPAPTQPREVAAPSPPPPPPPPPEPEPVEDDKDWFKPKPQEAPPPDDDKDWFKSPVQQAAPAADDDKDWFKSGPEPAAEEEDEAEEPESAQRDERWFPEPVQQLHEVVPPAEIPPSPVVVPPPESAGWDKRVAPLREEADLSAHEINIDPGPATIVHGAGAAIVEKEYTPPPPEPVEEEAPKPRRERRPIHIETPSAGRAIGTALVTAAVAGIAIAGAFYFTHRATPGTITFETKPIGLDLLQDGVVKGKTPVTLVLSPGSYEFALRRGKTMKPFHIEVKEGSHETQKVDFSNLKPVGTLAITTDPPGAKITLDGKARGTTPQKISDVPIGSHTVVLDGEQGTIRRQVNVEEQETTTLNEGIFPGFLKVDASFDVEVREGSRTIGTSDGQISLRAGRHEIELVNESQGYREKRTVDINPGEIKRILAK